MVSRLNQAMAWCQFLAVPGVVPRYGSKSLFGCCWFTGFWGLLPRTVALWLLGCSSTIAVHCLQGTISRGYCSLCLGPQWCKRHVWFRSDNDAVVHILNSRTAKIACLMRLLRHLLLSAACHSFSSSAQQVPGINNQLADALSRFHG